MAKRSWQQKLESASPPRRKRTLRRFADIPADTPFYISSPAEIRELILTLEPGEFLSPKEIRAELASRSSLEYTCPVTTGIFLRVVAEAAWEHHLGGTPLTAITPFWRAIPPESPLAEKLTCGADFVRRLRDNESEV